MLACIVCMYLNELNSSSQRVLLYQLRPCLEVHRRIKSYYGIISPNDSERFDNEDTPC